VRPARALAAPRLSDAPAGEVHWLPNAEVQQLLSAKPHSPPPTSATPVSERSGSGALNASGGGGGGGGPFASCPPPRRAALEAGRKMSEKQQARPTLALKTLKPAAGRAPAAGSAPAGANKALARKQAKAKAKFVAGLDARMAA